MGKAKTTARKQRKERKNRAKKARPPPHPAPPPRRRRRRRRRSPRVQRFAPTAATAATCPGHGCWLTLPTRSSLAGAWSQEGQDAGRCVGSCWWIAHAGEAGPQRKYHMCIRVYATANCGRSRAVITMNQKPNKVTHRSATLALALCSALVYLEHVPPCHPWHTSFSVHRSLLLHNGLASKRVGPSERLPSRAMSAPMKEHRTKDRAQEKRCALRATCRRRLHAVQRDRTAEGRGQPGALCAASCCGSAGCSTPEQCSPAEASACTLPPPVS